MYPEIQFISRCVCVSLVLYKRVFWIDECCVRNAFDQAETEIRRCNMAGCHGVQHKE
jgi:hypothetical protein